jgi:hypothetical protein
MGKTVEPFRIALENEICWWSGFGKALRQPEWEAFLEAYGFMQELRFRK